MSTSKNSGFHVKGQYRKCDSKPYCIDFSETFGNISFQTTQHEWAQDLVQLTNHVLLGFLVLNF